MRGMVHCAPCGPDPHANGGNSDQVFTTHMRARNVGGRETLTPESIAQLRQLDRGACLVCGFIPSRRRHRCNRCRADTATRETWWLVTSFKTGSKLAIRKACREDHQATDHRKPRDPLDDSPAPDCPGSRHHSDGEGHCDAGRTPQRLSICDPWVIELDEAQEWNVETGIHH